MIPEFALRHIQNAWRRTEMLSNKRFARGLFLVDQLRVFLTHGATPTDYYLYELYNLSRHERNEFLFFRDEKRIVRLCNDAASAKKILNNKVLFNKHFGDFIHRDWLAVGEVTLGEFTRFSKKHAGFFVKPISSSGGNGIYWQNIDRAEKIETTYRNLKEKNFLIEQKIQQSEDLSEFNPGSVNTLRITTLRCADGIVRPMTGVIRFGRMQSCVDNFRAGGVAASVDVNTGVVSSSAVNKNGQRFVTHPDSGKLIVGFQIPYWDRVMDVVVGAASLMAELRYVGWDIAILSNGNIEIVEANFRAGVRIQQAPEGRGKRRLYERCLRGIERQC